MKKSFTEQDNKNLSILDTTDQQSSILQNAITNRKRMLKPSLYLPNLNNPSTKSLLKLKSMVNPYYPTFQNEFHQKSSSSLPKIYSSQTDLLLKNNVSDKSIQIKSFTFFFSFKIGKNLRFSKIDSSQLIVQSDQKFELLQKLSEQREKILKHLSQKNPEPAIELVKDMVKVAISLKETDLFAKTLELLADLYLTNRDYQNGIYLYNQLRSLADFTENHQLKVKVMLELSNTCKILNKIKHSKIFLKKALQYVWLIQDSEQETQIYDKLGLIYYLQGNLERAQEFHDRAMNFLNEMESSPSKKHSLEIIRKHLKGLPFKTNQMSDMLLAKMGMIGEQQEEEIQDDKKLSVQKIKLSTQVDLELQLEQMMADQEFELEINTPNNQTSQITKDGIIQDEYLPRYQKEVVHLHKLMKRNVFQLKKYTQESLSKKRIKYIDESQEKMDIDQKIHHRLMEAEKKETTVEKYIKQLSKFHCFQNFSDNFDKCLVNHLSPNRNGQGFLHYKKQLAGKAKLLFDDFQHQIINKQIL